MPHQWTTQPEPHRLSDVVADSGYAERVGSLIERVGQAPDPPALQVLFVECVAAMGAPNAVFVSILHHPSGLAAGQLMLACDPAWGRRFIDSESLEHSPWLAYARRHSEPLVTTCTGGSDDGSVPPGAGDWRDFASVLLAPAHASPGSPRTSLLCLGSPVPDYFEDFALGRVRLGARLLAAELHDWWQARTRREVLANARLTSTDLDLLRLQHRGLGSKRIARELHLSVASVNSRFQRMNARLGLGSRRAAAQWAAVLGLIEG